MARNKAKKGSEELWRELIQYRASTFFHAPSVKQRLHWLGKLKDGIAAYEQLIAKEGPVDGK